MIGSFADDLRGFAGHDARHNPLVRHRAPPTWFQIFPRLNVISAVAHQQSVGGQLMLQNTLYALFYTAMALSGAVLIFRAQELEMI